MELACLEGYSATLFLDDTLDYLELRADIYTDKDREKRAELMPLDKSKFKLKVGAEALKHTLRVWGCTTARPRC